MPLNPNSRNITAGGSSPYIPLITNNPAFQVAIVPLNGAMEQKPNQKDDSGQQAAIAVGNTIRGNEVRTGEDEGNRCIGKVIAIIEDGGSITGYKILGQNGKEVIIDPSTAVKVQLNGDDPAPMSAPQTQLENYTPSQKILLYEEWNFNKKNR